MSQRQRPAKGDTIPQQGETQERAPRLPHERDESAGSQEAAAAANQRMGKIAHDAVESGQRDTGKAAVLDATYQKVREKGGAKPR